jgi:integrase/recombinase XerD
MPTTLSTTVRHIYDKVPNSVNSQLIVDFHSYMKDNTTSERHQNNNLKAIIAFAEFLGSETTFYQISTKDQVTKFLDTKTRSNSDDPENRWITTWNDYLVRIKHFFRWLHNYRIKFDQGQDQSSSSIDWQTPAFVNIKKKRTKRISPYGEHQIWEIEELKTIIKYEPQKRNKAILSLLWDLNGRNHEITLLQIKHIRLRERYGEGEIPHQAKTGSGPILLTFSLPYVRDWLNEHPFRNTPEARLICSLNNGAPIKPEALWTMMNQLRLRISRLIETGSITDKSERGRLQVLLNSKRFNPYCLRHSSISHDSDYLPEYALKKKVRWSMNSKQPSRYIKARMGNNLKEKILLENGIISNSESRKSPSVLSCPRCSFINAVDCRYCSKCSYPLTPKGYEEIKEQENAKFRSLEERFNTMHSQMENLITIIGSIKQSEGKQEIAKRLIEQGIYEA